MALFSTSQDFQDGIWVDSTSICCPDWPCFPEARTTSTSEGVLAGQIRASQCCRNVLDLRNEAAGLTSTSSLVAHLFSRRKAVLN